MTHAESQREFRSDIEGLRAVAVVAVVLFHAAVPGITGGYVGVDVFFVISGFLITGLLWREVSSTGTVRLGAFYGARARRLLPASAAVGVVTMCAAAALLPPLQVHPVLLDGILSALYVGNFRFGYLGVDYFGADLTVAPSPFLHYWSLGVEEQFYLIWAPLVLFTAWVVRRVRRRRRPDRPAPALWPFVTAVVLVGAGSFALSLLYTTTVAPVAFYSLPTRAWQLALGGLIALTVARWRSLPTPVAAALGWTGLGLILLACFVFDSTTPFPGTAALLPTLGAALVIVAGCSGAGRGCGRLLSTRPMRAIGRISYSWYLWHWPVLVLTPLAVGHPLGLPARLAAALAAAGLAWLTWRYLENPVRFSPAVRTSPRRSLAVGAVATVLAAAVGAGLTKAVPAPVGPGAPVAPVALALPPERAGEPARTDAAVAHGYAQMRAALVSADQAGPVPSNLDPQLADADAEEVRVYLGGCLRGFFETGHPDCVFGDPDSDTAVALIGDSHAAMWHPAFERIAEQRGWRLETMARAGCPFLDLAVKFAALRADYTECTRWRETILQRLRERPPRLVVLSHWRGYGPASLPAGLTVYDRAWLDSLTEMVRRLHAIGADVLVLGPVPAPQTMVPVCVSGHLDDRTACAPSRSTAVDAAGIAGERRAAAAGGGRYADLTDLFCTDERCPVIVGNTLVYFDDNHMTMEYGEVLAPVLGALADRALGAAATDR